jgi:hypothetical protein
VNGLRMHGSSSPLHNILKALHLSTRKLLHFTLAVIIMKDCDLDYRAEFTTIPLVIIKMECAAFSGKKISLRL